MHAIMLEEASSRCSANQNCRSYSMSSQALIYMVAVSINRMSSSIRKSRNDSFRFAKRLSGGRLVSCSATLVDLHCTLDPHIIKSNTMSIVKD